jgi:hypothetical protein
MKVERLSALRTGRLYPPGKISDTFFCYGLSRPQDHSAAGETMSMKNLKNPTGIFLFALSTSFELVSLSGLSCFLPLCLYLRHNTDIHAPGGISLYYLVFCTSTALVSLSWCPGFCLSVFTYTTQQKYLCPRRDSKPQSKQ